MDTAELDQKVKNYRELRERYSRAKAEATELHKSYKECEFELMDALEKAGKKKYFVDGVGTVTKVEKMRVTVPKGMEEKKQFFKYLIREGGEELLYTYATVNSMSLNKFYNDTKEDKGLDHEIPGIELPTLTTELRFKGGN